MGEKRAFCYLRGDGEEEGSLTYRELHERAMAIAAELQSSTSPGDRALLLFPAGLEFIAAFFGCLYAGVVAVPAAPPGRNRSTSSADAIFDAAKPSLVLSTADYQQQASQSNGHFAKLFQRRWIATDRVAPERQHAWRDLQVTSRQIAFLQYTSGSTSSPKGVVLNHRNLLLQLGRDPAGLRQHARQQCGLLAAVVSRHGAHRRGDSTHLLRRVVYPAGAGGLPATARFMVGDDLPHRGHDQRRPEFRLRLVCPQGYRQGTRRPEPQLAGRWPSWGPSRSAPKRWSGLPRPLPPADSAARRFFLVTDWLRPP